MHLTARARVVTQAGVNPAVPQGAMKARSRPFVPLIVAAADAIDGDAIYLSATGGWTRRASEAAVARSPTEAAALLVAAETQPDTACDPVLIELTVGTVRPQGRAGAA